MLLLYQSAWIANQFIMPVNTGASHTSVEIYTIQRCTLAGGNYPPQIPDTRRHNKKVIIRLNKSGNRTLIISGVILQFRRISVYL